MGLGEWGSRPKLCMGDSYATPQNKGVHTTVTCIVFPMVRDWMLNKFKTNSYVNIIQFNKFKKKIQQRVESLVGECLTYLLMDAHHNDHNCHSYNGVDSRPVNNIYPKLATEEAGFIRYTVNTKADIYLWPYVIR